jgi:hypothetical protein
MYTLWSHGELLGESALDYVRVINNLRTGDLHLTSRGLMVLDRLAQTHADAYYSARRLHIEPANESDEKSLVADLAAERDQYESLDLELRAPDGRVIPSEDIYIRDTEFLLAIDEERDDDDEESLKDLTLVDILDSEDLEAFETQLKDLAEDPEPWVSDDQPREPARFQLYVRLQDEWSIP